MNFCVVAVVVGLQAEGGTFPLVEPVVGVAPRDAAAAGQPERWVEAVVQSARIQLRVGHCGTVAVGADGYKRRDAELQPRQQQRRRREARRGPWNLLEVVVEVVVGVHRSPRPLRRCLRTRRPCPFRQPLWKEKAKED